MRDHIRVGRLVQPVGLAGRDREDRYTSLGGRNLVAWGLMSRNDLRVNRRPNLSVYAAATLPE
jgi:hypothetical protein